MKAPARDALMRRIGGAINRWPGEYTSGRPRSCRLCGNPNPCKGSDGLCRACRRAPLDGQAAADALAEWADLDYLLGRRATVDELEARMDAAGWEMRDE